MEDFKNFEKNAWERKAALYDDTWGSVTSQPISSVLLEAGLESGSSLLDCGCGPGHLCSMASRQGATVIGCDFSKEMLSLAKANYPTINFMYEDAENLSFEDGRFDAIVLNYLLLHVANQDSALFEARRVIRGKGRLVFSVWRSPQDSPGFSLMFAAIKKYADMTVIPPAQDIFMYADPDRAARFLSSAGFVDIKTQIFETAWHVKSPEAFFKAVQAGARIGGLLELQNAEIKEKIKSAIFAEIENFRCVDGYIIPTPTLIVSATKEEVR